MNWKDVIGYEGLYRVSDAGLIKASLKFVKGANGKNRVFNGEVLKSKVDNNGNEYVTLKKDGKGTNHIIQELVEAAFGSYQETHIQQIQNDQPK